MTLWKICMEQRQLHDTYTWMMCILYIDGWYNISCWYFVYLKIRWALMLIVRACDFVIGPKAQRNKSQPSWKLRPYNGDGNSASWKERKNVKRSRRKQIKFWKCYLRSKIILVLIVLENTLIDLKEKHVHIHCVNLLMDWSELMSVDLCFKVSHFKRIKNKMNNVK